MTQVRSKEEILKEIESKVEQPFVTARFGDNWRQHYKQMLNKAEITEDVLLDIAWKNGRTVVLLERVIDELIANQVSETGDTVGFTEKLLNFIGKNDFSCVKDSKNNVGWIMPEKLREHSTLVMKEDILDNKTLIEVFKHLLNT